MNKDYNFDDVEVKISGMPSGYETNLGVSIYLDTNGRPSDWCLQMSWKHVKELFDKRAGIKDEESVIFIYENIRQVFQLFELRYQQQLEEDKGTEEYKKIKEYNKLTGIDKQDGHEKIS